MRLVERRGVKTPDDVLNTAKDNKAYSGKLLMVLMLLRSVDRVESEPGEISTEREQQAYEPIWHSRKRKLIHNSQ